MGAAEACGPLNINDDSEPVGKRVSRLTNVTRRGAYGGDDMKQSSGRNIGGSLRSLDSQYRLVPGLYRQFTKRRIIAFQ